MATQQRAAAVGADNVVSIWKSMNDGNPYFAVYLNRNNKYFQFNRDDMEAAESFLSANLDAIGDTGDNTLYYLNVYAEPGKNYPNSGMVCSIPFRLNEYKGAEMGAYVPDGSDAISKIIEAGHARHIELIKEIAELKAANQPLDWWDKIGGLMETPGAAQTIVPLLSPVLASIMGIVNKFTGIAPAPMAGFMPPGIAGAELPDLDKDAALDAALDRLALHGDLVEMLTALADFADKNPIQFKMYFRMMKGE